MESSSDSEPEMGTDTVPEENVTIHEMVFNPTNTPISIEIDKNPIKQPREELIAFAVAPSLESSKISISKEMSFVGESFSGELLRYKPSSVDFYLPRWCTLDKNGLIYYKSRHAALFEEPPLMSIPIDAILSVYAYKQKKKPNFLLEINTNDTPPADTSPASCGRSVSLTISGHLMHRPRHLLPRPVRFTTPAVKTKLIPNRETPKDKPALRTGKRSWTNRENEMYLNENRLLFAVNSEDDWETWKSAFGALTSADIIVI